VGSQWKVLMNDGAHGTFEQESVGFRREVMADEIDGK